MNNYELLNNVKHQSVKVITDRSADYGDNLQFAVTFPLEFRRIQSHYPIFLQKDNQTGKFFPIALFGFEAGENLYLSENGWDAEYIPLSVKRHPFVIGYQQTSDPTQEKQAVISIDMESPRVNETEGEALFQEHGGTSSYLSTVTEVLESIQVGIEMNEEFIDALLEHDLVESVNMEIELKDGSRNQLLGLYTINEDNLEQLEAEALGKLHQQRHLQSIYMIMASLSSFSTLIQKRNDRLPQE